MSKLTWANEQDGTVTKISVAYAGRNYETRCYASWHIQVFTALATYSWTNKSGSDCIYSGVGEDWNPVKMLITLGNFLTAWFESRPNGESADLFPDDMNNHLDEQIVDVMLLELGAFDD